MAIKQSDIAKLARVSQATVSRVLSGDARVEPQIRDRVLTVVREHNYRPDVRARAFRLSRTGLIGLVLKRPHGGLVDDPFFAVLTSAIVDALSGKDYHLCLDMVTDEYSQESVYDEMLRTRRVDGLILVEPEADDERVELLQQDRFPFVIIGNPNNPEIASIDNDNVLAGSMATQHLIDGGFKRIGFIGGPRGVAVSDDRIQGYCESLSKHGLTEMVWNCEFGLDAAKAMAEQIFLSAPLPDAIVVLDDFMAFGVLLAARSRLIRVPDDVALVSFNDSVLCRLVEGGLTSVNLNIEMMVNRAISRLLQIIDAEESAQPGRELVPTQLSIRGSSTPRTAVAR